MDGEYHGSMSLYICMIRLEYGWHNFYGGAGPGEDNTGRHSRNERSNAG